MLDVCKISKSCSGANRQADSRGLIVVSVGRRGVAGLVVGVGTVVVLLASHADAMMPASAPSLAHAQARRFSVRCKVMYAHVREAFSVCAIIVSCC